MSIRVSLLSSERLFHGIFVIVELKNGCMKVLSILRLFLSFSFLSPPPPLKHLKVQSFVLSKGGNSKPEVVEGERQYLCIFLFEYL